MHHVLPAGRARLRLVAAALAAGILLAGAGCGGSDEPTTTAAATTAGIDPNAKPANPEPETGHWSYSGDTGPSHWGDLDPAYAACSAGQRQSPIDVAAPKPAAFPGVAFRYQAEPYSISNTGHGIQLDATKSRSTIALDGTTYVLDQFHFHAPSEHTLNGRTHAMEMHIVHQSADGRAAVVAVFIDAGASNPAFDAITADLPKQKGQDVALEGEIDAADLLPAGKSTVYRYTGSLTTPPCTEGVTFTVYDKPISLSKEQIGAFTAIYDHNARPVQPLNGRDVRSGAAAPATPRSGS